MPIDNFSTVVQSAVGEHLPGWTFVSKDSFDSSNHSSQRFSKKIAPNLYVILDFESIKDHRFHMEYLLAYDADLHREKQVHYEFFIATAINVSLEGRALYQALKTEFPAIESTIEESGAEFIDAASSINKLMDNIFQEYERWLNSAPEELQNLTSFLASRGLEDGVSEATENEQEAAFGAAQYRSFEQHLIQHKLLNGPQCSIFLNQFWLYSRPNQQ